MAIQKGDKIIASEVLETFAFRNFFPVRTKIAGNIEFDGFIAPYQEQGWILNIGQFNINHGGYIKIYYADKDGEYSETPDSNYTLENSLSYRVTVHQAPTHSNFRKFKVQIGPSDKLNAPESTQYFYNLNAAVAGMEIVRITADNSAYVKDTVPQKITTTSVLKAEMGVR